MDLRSFKSDFFRSVTVLMSGTLAAQVIGYLISPVITRIYTPEDMGELGLFMRIVGFLSAIVTARFEMSLVLPRHEGHAFLLYRLAIRIMIITTIVMIAVMGLYYAFYDEKNGESVGFTIMALCSTVLVALINLGTNWSIRNKHFKQISFQRFANSISSNGFKLGFGLLSMGATGLLLATVIGYLFSSFTYLRDYYLLITRKFKNYSTKKTRVLALEYKQFPMVNLPHVMTDLGRDMLVGTIIVAFFSKEVFGYFSHSYLMLRLPLVIIGASMGQVLFQKCTAMVNEGRPIFPSVRKTMVALMALSVPPFLIIMLFGEPLFAFVFGDQWGVSGEYAQIMSFWLMMNFLISPLSNLPIVLNKTREFFIISIIGSVMQVLGFALIPMLMGHDDEVMKTCLWVVSVSQSVYLIIVGSILMKYVKSK